MTTTIPRLLRERAEHQPDARLLQFESTRISYDDLNQAADKLAAGFLQLGLKPGDRIAIAASNSPNWLTCLLASTRIGAVLVTLSVLYREREFDSMINQSGARALVCDAEAGGFDFTEFVDGLRPQIPSVEHFVFIGGHGFEASHSFEDVAGTDPDGVPIEDYEAGRQPDDPAVILFTSGTTGVPKGATLTHRSILASAAAQAERFEQSPDDVILGVMPFNHVGGLSCTFASSLWSGAGVHLLPRFHPDLIAPAINDGGVTMFVGVPTMYSLTLDSGVLTARDTHNIRLCVIGGSNLEPALAHRVSEVFPQARMANLYGMSETSGACIISAADDSRETITRTLGTPLSGVEVDICDDNQQSIEAGHVGELVVRSAMVADGYWGQPDDTSEAFTQDGWVRSGDIASNETTGHVRLHGRQKEMFVRGGYNVYPAEVEDVISGSDDVAMCAVIGVPHDVYGETGMAIIVPVAGAGLNVDRLRDMCAAALAEYKVPDTFKVVDTLPMTPAGKIQKVALRSAMLEA